MTDSTPATVPSSQPSNPPDTAAARLLKVADEYDRLADVPEDPELPGLPLPWWAQEKRRQANMLRRIVTLAETASGGRECSGVNCGGCTAGRAMGIVADCFLVSPPPHPLEQIEQDSDD